jgi:cytoskeletal protein RodZ
MKTVGKQLQDARLAKNWTPELAARETKIKVDRLRDLEADDYSNFTSPTYARGFVRTYARALGLDEYRILRQLDNKLPDDDSANIVTDNSGVAYLPETAMPPRVAHRDFTGLYIVMGLGAVVTLAIVFVLFEAYRVGELARYFKSGQETVAANPPSNTNAPAGSTNSNGDTVARALPIDSNTPPPVVEAPAVTNAPVGATTNAPTNTAAAPPGPVSPRALPVDPSLLGAGTDTNAAPVAAVSPRALPVDAAPVTNAALVTPAPTEAASKIPPSDPTTNAPTNAKAPPRALPVSPAELAAAKAELSGAPATNTLVAVNTPPAPVPVNVPPPAPTPTIIHPSASARQSNSGPVMEPSLPPVAPSAEPTPAPVTPTPVPANPTPAAPQTAAPPAAAGDSDKRLVLTASQDSFVRVTKLDGPDADKPLYASVLHSGQSVGFNGHKFSINVGVPSAVDIKLDGVNYGPHSDQDVPETFIVQSHLP